MSQPTGQQQSSTASAIAHYTRRAPTYDNSNNGWHVTFAQEQVNALSVPPGAKCLDLACGTGLLSFPLALAAGPMGLVIGVDVTPAMLNLARARLPGIDGNSAPVEFIEADITAATLADASESIQTVLSQHGGFDVITCGSALVLLADPAAAITQWAKLLKAGGGKLLADVPTETHTLQYLFSWELRDAMGMRNDFNRSWVRDVHSLERLCEMAGLKVVRSWRSGNLVGGREGTTEEAGWRTVDGERVFEEQVGKYAEFMDLEGEGKKEELKRKFLQMWQRECEKGGGVFRDGHWVYVTIAEKV